MEVETMNPESLTQQCHNYVMLHLEEFPIDYLSLLPLYTRKRLIDHLPIADVCLRLERTPVTEGLDMAAFWDSTWKHNSVGMEEDLHKEDVKYMYVQDKYEYARETVYGIVAAYALDRYPIMEDVFRWDMTVIPFLYAVAMYVDDCKPWPVFPARYVHKKNKCTKDLTMYEVMNCFSPSKGEFPRIFPEFFSEDINLDDVFFLRNAVYLGMRGPVFHEQGLEFLKAVLKMATNLEVLLLDHFPDDSEEWEPVEFFDKFCTFLCSYQTFLSRFRLLKIFSSLHLKGFVVSQKIFNQLVIAYFAAPTDHMQRIHMDRTKIKCSDVSFECSPIEQRYRSFKTIQMDD